MYSIVLLLHAVICRHPPVLSGMEYVGLNPNGMWYSGSKVQFTCKTGYELLDSNGQYKGIQGDSTCSQSGWIFDSFCKGKSGTQS